MNRPITGVLALGIATSLLACAEEIRYRVHDGHKYSGDAADYCFTGQGNWRGLKYGLPRAEACNSAASDLEFAKDRSLPMALEAKGCELGDATTCGYYIMEVRNHPPDQATLERVRAAYLPKCEESFFRLAYAGIGACNAVAEMFLRPPVDRRSWERAARAACERYGHLGACGDLYGAGLRYDGASARASKAAAEANKEEAKRRADEKDKQMTADSLEQLRQFSERQRAYNDWVFNHNNAIQPYPQTSWSEGSSSRGHQSSSNSREKTSSSGSSGQPSATGSSEQQTLSGSQSSSTSDDATPNHPPPPRFAYVSTECHKASGNWAHLCCHAYVSQFECAAQEKKNCEAVDLEFMRAATKDSHWIPGC